MTEQDNGAYPQDQTRANWGDPSPQPKGHGSWKKAAGAVAIAAAVATGGIVAVNAASASSTSGGATTASSSSGTAASAATPTSGTAAAPPAGPGVGAIPVPHVPGHDHNGHICLGDALHGDFVVPGTTAGTYVTRRLQSGTVTAMSGGSLTVKSADGYVSSYTVDDVPLTGIGVKDTVTVVATVTGPKASLHHIREKGTDPDPGWGPRDGRGPLPGGRHGRPPGADLPQAPGGQQNPSSPSTTGSSAPTTG